MKNCKRLTKIPMEVGNSAGFSEGSESFDSTIYRKAIGNLLYLSNCTRPDIANSVCRLSQYCNNPTVSHWKGVQHVFRYLANTKTRKLLFKKGGGLSIFCDSDWAGDLTDGKSMTGYVILMSGGAVPWKSRKQKCVASSNTHAEYIALYKCCCELTWLKSFMLELGRVYLSPKTFEINCDNQAVIYIAENDNVNDRSKYFVVKYKFVRERVIMKDISEICTIM
jgi:hypothetical protein